MTVYLSAKQVAERFGVTTVSLWNWVGNGPYKNPDFPKPYKISPAVTRWKLDELEQFEARCRAVAK